MELPDISPSALLEKRKLEKQDSGFHTMSFRNSNFVSVEEADEGDGSEKGDSPEEGQPLLCAGSPVKGVRRRKSANGQTPDETDSLLAGRKGNSDHLAKNEDASTVLVNKASVLAADKEAKNPPIEELDESVELQEMSASGLGGSGSFQIQGPNSETPKSGRSDASSGKGSGSIGKRKVSVGASASSSPSTSSRGSAMSSPRSIMKKQTGAGADRQTRIQILQRELARIQRELKSLGELEVEVSYV